MKQIKKYTYLGVNGTITSTVLLENVPKVEKIFLIAEPDKALTKDNEHFYTNITIPTYELSLWYEVNRPANLN